MELKSWQVQKLIYMKNRLLDEASRDYAWASIEQDEKAEARYLMASSLKESIAQELTKIIYSD